MPAPAGKKEKAKKADADRTARTDAARKADLAVLRKKRPAAYLGGQRQAPRGRKIPASGTGGKNVAATPSEKDAETATGEKHGHPGEQRFGSGRNPVVFPQVERSRCPVRHSHRERIIA